MEKSCMHNKSFKIIMKETVDWSTSHVELEQRLFFFKGPPKDKRNIWLEIEETCILHKEVT